MYVSIIIGTLNRKEKLRRCINSILSSTYQNYSIYAIEDKQRLGIFKMWELGMSCTPGDAFMLLGDDVELDPFCIANAVKAMEEHFPDRDGLIGLAQEKFDHDYSKFGQVLLGDKFAFRYTPGDYVFYPDYTSFYGDTELGLRAKELGKFFWCEDAKLRHYHPAWFPGEMDETHEIVRAPERGIKDRSTFEARQAKGLLWGRSFERL